MCLPLPLPIGKVEGETPEGGPSPALLANGPGVP